jgi:hypothetical protein
VALRLSFLVFGFGSFGLFAKLPESLDRQRTTLPASHLDFARRFIAVDLRLMRQNLDTDLDAARVAVADAWLQGEEHVSQRSVECATLNGLGVGQANDPARNAR